jgi:hypothetical protein
MSRTAITIIFIATLIAATAQGAFVRFRTDMLFIGDSIGRGLCQASRSPGAPLHIELKDEWILQFTNYPLFPSAQMGTPTVLTELAGWLATRDYEYAVVEIGSHNSVDDPPVWGDFTTSGQYQTDLGTIFAALIVEVGSSANIFAVNSLQVDETASGLTNFNTNIIAYNDAMVTACAAESPAIPIFDMFTLTDPDTGPFEGNRDPDGIHYNDAGYAQIAGALATWIKEQ